MNIRQRIYLSLWIAGGVMLVVFATVYLSSRQIGLALEQNAFAGNIVASGVSGLRAVTVDYLFIRQQRALIQWQQRHASLGRLLAKNPYRDPAQRGIVDELRKRNAYLAEIFPRLSTLYASRAGDTETIELQRQVEARLATQIMVATQDMVTDADELMRLSHERLRQVQRRAAVVVSIAVASLGVFLVFAHLFAIRNVLVPIKTLQRGTEIIGAGDLSHRTELRMDNEVGALSRAFDAMTAKLAQTQAEMDRNALQLQATVRELEAFSYSVSHDLRAPLRGIDGWSLALLEDYGERLDAPGRQYLDTVRAETQRMGRLIDDLLQLSRVNRAEFKRGPVDLSAIAHTIASRLHEAHPHRRIEFLIEPGLTADADPRLLEIALTNLLDNACKFTGTRPAARIEVRGGTAQISEARGQPQVYMVRDNGVGFDMAHATRLFGAFQRLHPASEFPGTGIGLATAQRIVARHGGRIWAEAQPERGATFYFTFGEAT